MKLTNALIGIGKGDIVVLKRIIARIVIVIFVVLAAGALFSVFFDQVVLTRKGTTYHIPISKKVVALTFDDGPSAEWTPKILRELKKSGVKATFFMLGKHVREFPDIARLVAQEGHEIANHTYNHGLLPFSDSRTLVRQIQDSEKIIFKTTGVKTVLFRPPKAWLTSQEKNQIRSLGYRVVLWSLNSKDWVTFDDKFIVDFLVHNVRPGDIILFHDSGAVLGMEGGDRDETVRTIAPLVRKLRQIGYSFATVSELIELGQITAEGRK
jgi:peptidoglycan/xylan/chitin deacetylase (PgdA/CDA1 family)